MRKLRGGRQPPTCDTVVESVEHRLLPPFVRSLLLVHTLKRPAKLAKLATSLPYNALPLSFRLLRPLGTSTSPSVCLLVQLPLIRQGASPAGGDEDLRHGPQSPIVEVLRLIDPEHREPFVSLGRILLACSVPPVEALLRYNLDRLDYSTTLGGLAPFLDLWVPLKTARTIAADLGRLDELAALLEWETRGAYSVDDKEEGGLVHNWKIDSTRISPDEYSTASMLATPFPRIHLLPPGAQVRTLLPSLLTFPSLVDRPTDARPGLDKTWGRVVEWSIVAVEGWFGEADGEEEGGGGGQEAQQGRRARSPAALALASAPSSGTGTGADALAPLFLFSTLAPLLLALDLLPSPAPPPSTSSSSASPAPFRPAATTLAHLPSLPPLPRAALLPPPPSSSHSTDPDAPRLPAHATLYLVDAVARLVLHARRSSAEEEGAHRAAQEGRERGGKGDGEGEGETARGGEREWRAALEGRLAALELERGGGAGGVASGAPSSSLSSGASGAGARAAAGPVSASAGSGLGGGNNALQGRIASLEARLEALEGAVAPQKPEQEQARPLAAADGLASAAPGEYTGAAAAASTRADTAVFLAVLVLVPAVAAVLVGRWLAS